MRRDNAERPRRALFPIYLLCAVLVFVITSGKIGTASSYCLELVAILSVLAAVGLQMGLLTSKAQLSREMGVGLAVLVICPLALQCAQGMLTAQRTLLDSGPDDRALRANLQGIGGPTFSDNGYAVLNGVDPPAILDPYYFAALASSGRWDPEPLQQMAAQRYFGSLALRISLEDMVASKGFPQGILREMMAHYHLTMHQGAYYVYSRSP